MTAIIGPSRAKGWKEQFGYQACFGQGTTGSGDTLIHNAFASGSGTLFPFPSMSLAQAWRYYWAVKQWRYNSDLTITSVGGDEPVFPLDTGWIPYPCGYGGLPDGSGAGVIQDLSFGGDRLATPSIRDRYNLLTNGLPAPVEGGYGYGQDLFRNSIYQTFSENDVVQIFGKVGYAPGSSKYQSPFGLVWDDSTPGNVFLLFLWHNELVFTVPPTATANIYDTTLFAKMTAKLYLDGMVADIYAPAPGDGSAIDYDVTGGVYIDTKDTPVAGG